MSPSNVIEVPITRRDYAVKEMLWQDPKTMKMGLRGREWTSPETSRTCRVEVYDANGNTIFAWTTEDGPMNKEAFKSADYLSRQSFKAKGVQ